MKVRAERAGLGPGLVHPHRFRHTHAHDFLLAGGQERDLMRLLGWRSEAMLRRTGRVPPTTGRCRRLDG